MKTDTNLSRLAGDDIQGELEFVTDYIMRDESMDEITRFERIRQVESLPSAQIIKLADYLRAKAPAEAAPAAPEHVDDGSYTLVENYVLNHPELSGEAIAVYALLASRAHMPKMICTASLKWLSERTGWSRTKTKAQSKVKGAIEELKAIGAVEELDREPGGSSRWKLPHRHRSKPKKKLLNGYPG